MLKIRPLGEHLVVDILPEKNETPAGIVISDIHWVHRFRRGVVKAVGPRVPSHLKVGDRVVFAKEHFQYGTEKTVKYMLRDNGEDGAEQHIMKWYDLLMAIDPQDNGSYHEVA